MYWSLALVLWCTLICSVQCQDEIGRPGATGQRGRPGSPGPSGPVGSVGEAGSPGPVGPIGPPGGGGPAGSTGSSGQAGVMGATGQIGHQGSTGSTGPRGLPAGQSLGDTGTNGVAGPRGGTGFPGPQGSPGPAYTGPPGRPGATGATGLFGQTGSTGLAGMAGISGPAGPVGMTGPVGPIGLAGPPGMYIITSAGCANDTDGCTTGAEPFRMETLYMKWGPWAKPLLSPYLLSCMVAWLAIMTCGIIATIAFDKCGNRTKMAEDTSAIQDRPIGDGFSNPAYTSPYTSSQNDANAAYENQNGLYETKSFIKV